MKLIKSHVTTYRSKEIVKEEKIRDILRWSIDEGRLSYINELIGAQFSFLWVQPTNIDVTQFDNKFFGNSPVLKLSALFPWYTFRGVNL